MTSDRDGERIVQHSLRLPTFQPTRVDRILLMILAASFAGDVVTTWVGLRMGLNESNPYVIAAIDRMGFAGIVAMKAAVVSILLAYRRAFPRKFHWPVTLALAAPWSLATVANTIAILINF